MNTIVLESIFTIFSRRFNFKLSQEIVRENRACSIIISTQAFSRFTIQQSQFARTCIKKKCAKHLVKMIHVQKLSFHILTMLVGRCWSNYCPKTCKCASSNCCLPISSTKVQLSVHVLKFLLNVILFDGFCVIVVKTTC